MDFEGIRLSATIPLPADRLRRVNVTLPASLPQRVTLLDTPGLASTSVETSAVTARMLEDTSDAVAGGRRAGLVPDRGGDIFYKVLWTTDSARADQAIVTTYESAIGSPKRNFTITGDPTIVGSKVSGGWTDKQGRARYSCVWQYNRYPIALVVTGVSASSVSPACDAVTVYDNAQLADRVG
jgi:hypothetical protein